MAEVEDRLWATPLDEQRRRDEADARERAASPGRADPAPAVTGPPAPTEPTLPDPAAPDGWRPLLAIGAFAVAIGIALAAADHGTDYLAKPVPSEWGAVAMRCDTARFERGTRSVELFHCRAQGNGILPAGLYASPRTNWRSDLTRIDARSSRVAIDRDGALTGWATYSFWP